MEGKRGQVLSYDAIGGVVIFLIAVGILVAYWSALSASFSDEDANLALEANTVLDNMMVPGVLMLADGYHLNESVFRQPNCGLDQKKDEVGLIHNFYIEVIDSTPRVVASCGFPPSNPQKIVISERLAYYGDEPVKVVMKVYT